jgi:hypothetical protein
VKNICKAAIFASLLTLLTSCAIFAGKPAEIVFSTLTPAPALTTTQVSQSIATSVLSTQTPPVPVMVDRRNPESVLRAYFDAWEQSDWPVQLSMMAANYANMAPEPVDSISILEIQPLSNSSLTERTYHVVFEIKVKGQGISMHTGRYEWSFYLTWDARRDSWLITNYGGG